MNEKKGRPLSRAAVAEPGMGGASAFTHYSIWPCVLQTWKRQRWVTVGKIVELGGRPVLATAVRHQQGTATTVSMPVLAIEYAERCGCRWWYYRDDRTMVMRRIRLDDLRRRGWLQSDGELYIKLADMERVPWQRWDYATKVVQLGGDVGVPQGTAARRRGEDTSNTSTSNACIPDCRVKIPPEDDEGGI